MARFASHHQVLPSWRITIKTLYDHSTIKLHSWQAPELLAHCFQLPGHPYSRSNACLAIDIRKHLSLLKSGSLFFLAPFTLWPFLTDLDSLSDPYPTGRPTVILPQLLGTSTSSNSSPTTGPLVVWILRQVHLRLQREAK